MARFYYGAREPQTHFAAIPFAAHPAAQATRPRAFDAYSGPFAGLLEDDDQGDKAACVGFATAQIMRFVLVKAGMADPGPLSPWMAWALGRQFEQTLGQNAGMDPHDVITLLARTGLCTLDRMPDPGPNLDRLPDAAALADAGSRSGIQTYQASNLDELLTAVGTLQVPVSYCIAVYNDFEQPHPDETLDAPSGTILGYHNIQIRSYNDDTRTLRVHNQWRGWTRDNEVTLTYTQAQQIWSQGWVITHPAITPVPSPIDTFWERWGPWGDDIARRRDVAGLAQQGALADAWAAYLKAAGTSRLPAHPPLLAR